MFSSPLNPLSSPTQQCSSFCEIIYNTNNKSKIQIVRLYCSVTSKRHLATSAWRVKKPESPDWCVGVEDNKYLVDKGMGAKARKTVSFSGKRIIGSAWCLFLSGLAVAVLKGPYN